MGHLLTAMLLTDGTADGRTVAIQDGTRESCFWPLRAKGKWPEFPWEHQWSFLGKPPSRWWTLIWSHALSWRHVWVSELSCSQYDFLSYSLYLVAGIFFPATVFSSEPQRSSKPQSCPFIFFILHFQVFFFNLSIVATLCSISFRGTPEWFNLSILRISSS